MNKSKNKTFCWEKVGARAVH